MQALGEVIGPVADVLRNSQNRRPRLGAEAAARVERLGRGPDRDAGEASHVAKGSGAGREGLVVDRRAVAHNFVHLTPPDSKPET